MLIDEYRSAKKISDDIHLFIFDKSILDIPLTENSEDLVRLPYPKIWIENKNLPNIGFYCEQKEEDIYFELVGKHRTGVIEIVPEDLIKMAKEIITRSLILLNSPKIIEIIPKRIRPSGNKRKTKLNSLVIHTVTLKSGIRKSLTESNKGIQISKRLHWVRGHFKRYESGLYWWNPHIRGSIDKGKIIKNYKVTV